MGTRGIMGSEDEVGTNRKSCDLSQVVEEGCVNDARKSNRFQAGHKHAP